MSETPGDSSEASTRALPTVFLLTDTAVLMQEDGTSLWRALPTEGSGSQGPAPAQLRALRREQARRIHPAGSGHRSSGAARSGAGTSFGIYNPLTSTWAPVPHQGQPARVGDALCWFLPDGRLVVGGVASSFCSTYDPGTNRWSTARSRSGGETMPPARGRHASNSAVIAVRMFG
jgi:hypothetical protein